MKTKVTLLFVLAVMLVAAISCQDRSNLTSTQVNNIPSYPPSLARVAATIDSAILYLYVESPGSELVEVHRATAAWNEATVTWNNFGNNFDAPVVTTFTPNSIGWQAINITSLVQGWINGDYPNYGVLLKQGPEAFTGYWSSDNADASVHPKLTICFSTGGIQECITIQRGFNGTVADAYMWEAYPDEPYGLREVLYTGFISGIEKRTVIKFNMPEFPDLAGIGDRVWFDDNRDGIQDLGEPGVPDVAVYLMDCAGNYLDTTITDANGFYWFGDLNPGNYNIHFTLPSGYVFSPQDQGGLDAIDSDADPLTGITACTELIAGEADSTWDAGINLPDEHCTRTIGYWKTHAGFGPQPDVVTPLLPIWLGTFGGTYSLNVTNRTMAVNILNQNVYGSPSNGITKLYAQLLGVKLNAANDADISTIAATIASADAFIATHYYTTWSGLSNSQKNMVLGWVATLDNYNNGLIGPIHCN
jgi:hypothetical protein